MADCGLRRVGGLIGIGRIAGCTSVPLQRKDARTCDDWPEYGLPNEGLGWSSDFKKQTLTTLAACS
eukprot:15469314-Alexandrium_andersonii.AAC.1